MSIVSIPGVPNCEDSPGCVSSNDLMEGRVVVYPCGIRPPLEKGATEPGLGKAVSANSCHHLPFGVEGSDSVLWLPAVLGDGDMWVTRRQ